MEFQAWLQELAEIMGGEYDPSDGCLLVDPGDGCGANSYAPGELQQFYRSKLSPREASDILRMGGMPG